MTVAIIGRPNVGKSTIFNRMINKRKSIVFDEAGVTRDRIVDKVTYKDKDFFLIDTGGFILKDEVIQKEINMQVELAIDEADLIIFVLDGTEGLTDDDQYIYRLLSKSNKKVIAVINKTDSKEFKDYQYDYYQLGIDLINVSAEANFGFYDLFEAIYPHITNEIKEEEGIKFAVLGKENTGKSSLINAILNEERNIVSNIPGTTRDSIDSVFKYHGETMIAIDTAGIKKRGKIYESLEKYAYLRTIQSLERADVGVVVIDGSVELSKQDKNIAGIIAEMGKPLIIVVSKWDEKLMDKDTMKQLLRNDLPFISYAPILFTSSVTKEGVFALMPLVKKVYENSIQELQTSKLNKVISDAYVTKIPPSYRGKRLKIYYTVQIRKNPMIIALYVNSPKLVHFSYDRYLKNRLREAFDFEGVPIILKYNAKEKSS